MKKHKITLATLKYYALKLRANRQLPLYLCFLIQKLDGDSDNAYIKYLSELSDHFLRVKGYYKKYPLADKESTELIKVGLQKMGYQVLDMNA